MLQIIRQRLINDFLWCDLATGHSDWSVPHRTFRSRVGLRFLRRPDALLTDVRPQLAMASNLKPLADRVVVRPKPKPETTPTGIVLPDTANERPQEGTVLAVGPGRVTDSGTRVAPEVKSGDDVLFARYAGTEVKLDDEEYLVMRETDLLAVVANGAK